MPNEEAQVLSEIRERLVRVETKIDAMTDVKATAESAKDMAMQAQQSARSAHHRIDEVSDNQKWIWRTVVGAALAAAVALITNLNGG